MSEIPPLPPKPPEVPGPFVPPGVGRRDLPNPYAVRQGTASKNLWWMVTLRVLAGIGAASVSGAIGWALASGTGQPLLFIVPPLICMGVFIFVAVKYKRFGYVSGFGFALAPMIVVWGLMVLLMMVCGNPGFR